MDDQQLSVPISGPRSALERALSAPLDAWAPGVVHMHSPRHVWTTLRVVGVPVEVDLLVDGPDVHPEPDRRLVVVRPRSHWLPQLEGALTVTDHQADRSRSQLVLKWWVHHEGPLPGPLSRLAGRLIARAILQRAAVAVAQMARNGR